MKRTDFEGMCELFKDGRLTWVENANDHKAGRVVSCGTDSIEVEVAGHRESWNASDCQEMTHGYRVNYDEVKKHPHEFDSHLD